MTPRPLRFNTCAKTIVVWTVLDYTPVPHARSSTLNRGFRTGGVHAWSRTAIPTGTVRPPPRDGRFLLRTARTTNDRNFPFSDNGVVRRKLKRNDMRQYRKLSLRRPARHVAPVVGWTVTGRTAKRASQDCFRVGRLGNNQPRGRGNAPGNPSILGFSRPGGNVALPHRRLSRISWGEAGLLRGQHRQGGCGRIWPTVAGASCPPAVAHR